MQLDLWEDIDKVLSVLITVGALLYWHFHTIQKLKDRLHELEKKCEGLATKDALKDLELEMKNLERTDALQQKTLDQLNDLFPILKQAVEALAQQKKQ